MRRTSRRCLVFLFLIHLLSFVLFTHFSLFDFVFVLFSVLLPGESRVDESISCSCCDAVVFCRLAGFHFRRFIIFSSLPPSLSLSLCDPHQNRAVVAVVFDCSFFFIIPFEFDLAFLYAPTFLRVSSISSIQKRALWRLASVLLTRFAGALRATGAGFITAASSLIRF